MLDSLFLSTFINILTLQWWTMILLVNGERQTVTEGALSIADLLALNKVESPDMVAVQLNGEFVERAAYGSTKLGENDAVDFLYFMGGGGQ